MLGQDPRIASGLLLILLGAATVAPATEKPQFERLSYEQPDLVVDLGVGLWAWPLPMDYDRDGDLDLVVSCPDKPYNGMYWFENRGQIDPRDPELPVFEPAVRVGPGYTNVQVSFVADQPRVLVPGQELTDFRNSGFQQLERIYPQDNVHGSRLRANQWKWVDYDADGALDLVVGAEDWAEYGWDDAYDERGVWTRGPLHGYVYLVRNLGSSEKPEWEAPVKLKAAGEVIDVFGMPSPNLEDFDGDGDLDLLCGEFLDKFTYFENVGSRSQPEFATGRRLEYGGQTLTMDLQMIVPVAIDWDRDDDMDLVVGDEDGRVALMEHTGRFVEGMPVFEPPRYFRQRAADVKFGALVTPVGYDWDADGDEDLVCGNTAGYIGWIENLGGSPVRWAAPVYLKADGRVIRIMAGPNGSIQGPAEAKWGYTTLSVADWNHDELPDLVVNSIWGKVVWYQNVGTREQPLLTAARAVQVEWPGEPSKPSWTWWSVADRELVTQWRTTPCVVDFTGDGWNDLVMLDHEGYLTLFERQRSGERLQLLPGRRVFVDEHGAPLRLNERRAGGSGRRKLCFVDWNEDGRLDLLVNSANANLLLNRGQDAEGRTILVDGGPLAEPALAGHTTSPTTIDLDRDGTRELLIGAEDGFLYHLPQPTR